MTKTKRLKAQPIATESEFIATVNSAAARQAELIKIEAIRDAEIVKIQQGYAETVLLFETEIERLVERAATYAEAHRKELLPKERKSVELATAVYGWRTGTKKVGFASKAFTEALVIRALKAFGFEQYVRAVEEIAKDKIIADARSVPVEGGGEVLGLRKTIEQKGQPIDVIVSLSDFGLKLTQSESFYIEPKAESGETIKPAA